MKLLSDQSSGLLHWFASGFSGGVSDQTDSREGADLKDSDGCFCNLWCLGVQRPGSRGRFLAWLPVRSGGWLWYGNRHAYQTGEGKMKKKKKKQLTLRDLHSDPQKMADFMGWDLSKEMETEVQGYWPHQCVQVLKDPEEAFQDLWREYLLVINEKHPLLPKRQNWSQFLFECFSKGLGIKTGSIEARRKQALAERPDLYSPVEK